MVILAGSLRAEPCQNVTVSVESLILVAKAINGKHIKINVGSNACFHAFNTRATTKGSK